jgi:multidrug efflux system membrane fusion protein
VVFLGAVFVWQRGVGAEPKGGGQPKGDRSGKDSGGRGGRGGGRGGPSQVVGTVTHTGNIGVYFTGLGTVTPIYTVNVRARVDGELMKVNYREGDMVKAGQLLAEIDERPFQVQLEQAEGTMARDEALLNNARIDLLRYEKLLKQNAIQEQIYTTQKATVGQLEGEVKTDKGAVDSAKLQLVYCKITAPITGRIGLRLIDPGNIVHAADANGLLVITQIEPISVLFTITQDQLQEVLRRMAAHQKLATFAYDREGQTQIAKGSLTTVDNQIDPSTGTLRLRATFDNTGGKLFPNQFVNVRLLVQEKRGVVLLPTAAIQRTTSRTFVYVVKPDSTVEIRPITEGVVEGDESEITSGLQAGETVVLMGVDKLEEGAHVRVQIEGQGGRGRRGGTEGQPAGGDAATPATDDGGGAGSSAMRRESSSGGLSGAAPGVNSGANPAAGAKSGAAAGRRGSQK